MDLVEERHSVQEVLFQRNRDQLLDFFGRKSECFRLDLDRQRRELRKDVDGRITELHDAEEHRSGSNGDDQAPELQARSNDPADHPWKPRGAANSLRIRVRGRSLPRRKAETGRREGRSREDKERSLDSNRTPLEARVCGLSKSIWPIDPSADTDPHDKTRPAPHRLVSVTSCPLP